VRGEASSCSNNSWPTFPALKKIPPNMRSANPKIAIVIKIGVFAVLLYMLRALVRFVGEPEAAALLAANNRWR
jgi:hypothetical protein